jgi:RNA polymerase sigma factor (sigma-70 family)
LERYLRRLVGLVHERLRHKMPRGAADEEDVALSAFHSFCRRAEQGQFPRLDDREDLWEVLMMIALRKAVDLLGHESRKRRDWRRTEALEDDAPEPFSPEPDPALAAEVADQLRHLLGLLPDEQIRAIAVRRMEGHTNKEIAALVGCSLTTVERRLPIIRKRWKRELPE